MYVQCIFLLFHSSLLNEARELREKERERKMCMTFGILNVHICKRITFRRSQYVLLQWIYRDLEKRQLANKKRQWSVRKMYRRKKNRTNEREKKNDNTLNGSGRHLSYFARANTLLFHTSSISFKLLHLYIYILNCCAGMRVSARKVICAILVCNAKWHKIKINFPMFVSFKCSVEHQLCEICVQIFVLLTLLSNSF